MQRKHWIVYDYNDHIIKHFHFDLMSICSNYCPAGLANNPDGRLNLACKV